MFCPKCGKKNDDNSLFCTWCGAGFGSVSTQSLSAAPAASAPVEAPATHQELQTVSAAPIVSAVNSQTVQSAGEIKQPARIQRPHAWSDSAEQRGAHSRTELCQRRFECSGGSGQCCKSAVI